MVWDAQQLLSNLSNDNCKVMDFDPDDKLVCDVLLPGQLYNAIITVKFNDPELAFNMHIQFATLNSEYNEETYVKLPKEKDPLGFWIDAYEHYVRPFLDWINTLDDWALSQKATLWCSMNNLQAIYDTAEQPTLPMEFTQTAEDFMKAWRQYMDTMQVVDISDRKIILISQQPNSGLLIADLIDRDIHISVFCDSTYTKDILVVSRKQAIANQNALELYMTMVKWLYTSLNKADMEGHRCYDNLVSHFSTLHYQVTQHLKMKSYKQFKAQYADWLDLMN